MPQTSVLSRPIHPGWTRINHWLNALSVVVLAMSGWRIYDASPLYPFRFPADITLGGWLGGALQWHFAAMWLLAGNGLVYLVLNIGTGRLGRQFFPLSLHAIAQDLSAALRGRLAHDDLRHYNAVQKLAYLLVMLDLIVLVLSGLVLFKSVQFEWLRIMFGGYDFARHVHFAAMALLVAFVAVHLVMVLLVPRSLFAMLGRGQPERAA